MSLILIVVNFCLWLLVIGLAFAIVMWVLSVLGITVPLRIMQLIGAIVFLLVLIWFLQAVVAGGAHPPRLLMLPLGSL